MKNHFLMHAFIFSILFLASFVGCGSSDKEKTLVFHGDEYKFEEKDNQITVDLTDHSSTDTNKESLSMPEQEPERKFFIIINTTTREVIDYNTPQKINPYEFAYEYYFEYS
jgi:hypothetical protein